MKLPAESELKSSIAQELFRWDLREYFSKDSKNYWTLHYKNRLNCILQAISDFIPPGGKILDIGCSQATAAILLAERGYKVTAVDARPECIQYAKMRYEFGDCTFINGDATSLKLDHKFDAIILGEVIEHVPQPAKFIARCKELLRESGIIVLTTPNGLSPHNWLLRGYDPRLMESSEWADVQSGLGGRETHLFCFRPNQFASMLQRSGLKIERFKFLNSYIINPIGLHMFLPQQAIEKLNQTFSCLPILSKYFTMTLFAVARKVA